MPVFYVCLWEIEHGELYVKTSRTLGQDRLNSAVPTSKDFKESFEEILTSMVFAQIHTCTSFHELGYACACVHPCVCVSINEAVSVAPLAERRIVYNACFSRLYAQTPRELIRA